VGDNLALAVQIIVTLVTGFVIAMIANWKLCLVILCVIPLVGFQGYAQVKFLKGFSQDAKVIQQTELSSYCTRDKILSKYYSLRFHISCFFGHEHGSAFTAIYLQFHRSCFLRHKHGEGHNNSAYIQTPNRHLLGNPEGVIK
jgi:hypothetical protein